MVGSLIAGISQSQDEGLRYSQQQEQPRPKKTTAEIINSEHSELRLEKSNLVLLGPTGVGKWFPLSLSFA